MRLSKRAAVKVGLVAAALIAVAAAVIVGSVLADQPPDEWADKTEFCEEASALEVGAVGLSRTEHAAVLERLAETAPDELAEAFDEILHANEHPDRSMVDEDQMLELGTYIEATCGINLPGTESNGSR